MIFLLERIQKLTEDLKNLIYPKSNEILSYKMKKTKEKFENIQQLSTEGWEQFSTAQIWGGDREYYWFETEVVIPDDFDGKCVVYDMVTGREGLWDATNPQFTIFVNGKLVQGLDVNHRSIILTKKAVAGKKFRIILSAFTGDQNFSLLLKSHIRILDTKTEKYYYDICVPLEVAKLLDNEENSYITIISALNNSLNLLDLRKEYSDEYYQSLEKAQQYITKEFYEKHCGNSEAQVYCVGHTHIDVAWLWTLAVTEDKAVRSFSTVLSLMNEYPEYKFMSSQPQLYKYVKANAPKVFEEIKERVKEGRWETEGAMFVEADCNIASGESLIRQILYGKKFFKDEFGKDNIVLWLPDVFGYSAALPQIMKKCGIKYFMTTKISWNEFNKLPYDTFYWEGIDGTKILTHFIPARDYNAKTEKGSFETSHFTTYNGIINASQVKGGWQRYQQKHLNDTVLMSFGYGDGGGGPTKEMLEHQRRLSAGIPGCPKTVMSHVVPFFEKLENDVSNNKYLPKWVGELYLEYHRGTYTSMGRNKKYNRKSEFAYQNAETFAVIDYLLNGKEYPQKEINDGWEVILRNQFHDILPGSSIKEVYDDSKIEYENILSKSNTLITQSLNNIVENIASTKNSIVVFNPNGFVSSDVIVFELPNECDNPVIYDGNTAIACQKIEGNKAIFKSTEIMPKGYKAFELRDENMSVSSENIVSTEKICNKYFSIIINEKGHFKSIYDKAAQRELLKDGQCGNVIVSYEDKPHNFDAWDLNNYYTEKCWEIDDVQSIDVVEKGEVRNTLKIVRKYLDSVITQYIYVYNEIPRIDIKNEIDWKEKQIFVKCLFPVDIHSNEATFDIQYGNVKRPTHSNTSWDMARFEVCVHKWLDISEDDFGVSVINDCKYGCSVQDGVIGVSMLKSGIYPNPEADKEFHDFTFSIYPHNGSWKSAKTVAQAYQINNPLIAVNKNNEGGKLPTEHSLVKSSSDNIIIEVVKKAEDSNSIIIRLYECHNRRTIANVSFVKAISNAIECDMLEQEISSVDFNDNNISFEIKPYEIKTFKVNI